MEKSLIWVVEDDPQIAKQLQLYLDRYGFEVKLADPMGDLIKQFSMVRPDLVLLDVNLPKFDGFYWCQRIREQSNCPILFISARESKMDQVMALDYGGDDYITKPFELEIVMAKIRSHLRRAYGIYANQIERTIEVAGLVLYPERLLLTFGNQKVEFSHKETILMQSLMERPMRVISRERLLERLWDDQHFVDDNTLNVYMTRVRKKLDQLGIADSIQTVRGVGYKLNVTWRERE